MFRLISIAALMCLASASQQAVAAVIFSACPVAHSENSDQLADRFKPEPFTRSVRAYAKEFPKMQRYARWLFSDKPNSSYIEGGDAEARRVGLWLEDLELLNALASNPDSCHGETKPSTQALAIFPFVLRSKKEDGSNQYRVRYKVCEYYVDGERQLPLEDACHVLGRETGYSFDELKTRFTQLNSHIEESRHTLNAVVLGAGLLASMPTFRGLRMLKAGNLTSMAVALVPAGTAYYAVSQNWTDDLIRDIVDFKDSAEVALVGDLSSSTKVNMPMQDFVPYFSRYLSSMESEKPAQKISNIPTPAKQN